MSNVNLKSILKGVPKGGGSGIKGDWDCTPILGEAFQVMDAANATYDQETRTMVMPAPNEEDFVPNDFNVGVVKTDLEFGTIPLGTTKKFAIRSSDDFLVPTGMGSFQGVVFAPPSFTAEAMRTYLRNLFASNTSMSNNMLIVSAVHSGGDRILQMMCRFSTDNDPSGASTFLYQSSIGGTYANADKLTAGASQELWMSRQLHEGETYFILSQVTVAADGEVLDVTNPTQLAANPVVPSTMVAYLIHFRVEGGVYDPTPLSAVIELDAGPTTITVPEGGSSSGGGSEGGSGSDDGSGSGSGGYNGPTQEEWDLYFPGEAKEFDPWIQATFPPETTVNDQYRVKLNAPWTSATPYGIKVTRDQIVVVDNVQPTQEAFRGWVDTNYLQQALDDYDVQSIVNNSMAAAIQASGTRVFFISSTRANAFKANAYATFAEAYSAAVLLPTHIRKLFVFDDATNTSNAGIPQRENGDAWMLAANCISVMTLSAWACGERRKFGDVYNGYHNDWSMDYRVDVYAAVDALHIEGGLFRLNHNYTNSWSSPYCITNGGDTVSTPYGDRKRIEMSDGAALAISPLGMDLRGWYYLAGSIGDNCAIRIFAQMNSSNSGDWQSRWPEASDIQNLDTVNSIPGMSDTIGSISLAVGEGFDFLLAGNTYHQESGDNGDLTVYVRGIDVDINTMSYFPYTVNYDRVDSTNLNSSIELGFRKRAEYETVRLINNQNDLFKLKMSDSSFDDPGDEFYRTLLYGEGGSMAWNSGGDFNIGSPGIHLVSFQETYPVVIRATGSYKGRATLTMTDYDTDGFFDPVTTYWGRKPVPWTISGFNFYRYGLSTHQPLRICRNLNDNNEITYENCYFNIQNGLIMPNGGKVVFRDCTFICDSSSIARINVDGDLGYVLFKDCRFEYMISNGTNEALFQLNGHNCKELVFDGCTILSAYQSSNNTYDKYPALLSLGIPGSTATGRIVVKNSKREIVENYSNTPTPPNIPFVKGDVTLFEDFQQFNDQQVGYSTDNAKGKSVIDVYTLADLPISAYGEDRFMNANTIYRVHGLVGPISSALKTLAGTEIVGVRGVEHDALTWQPNVEYPLYISDGGATVEDVAINYTTETGNPVSSVGIASSLNNDPILFRNVRLNDTGTLGTSIAQGISIISNAIPSITFDNVSSNMLGGTGISAGGGNLTNVTIKNCKADPVSGESLYIDFVYQKGNVLGDDRKPFTGIIRIHDNELTREPLQVATTQLSQLTSTDQIAAWNNKGFDGTTGLYGHTLTTYCVNVNMSDTHMIAEGNIFGAPNSP